MSDTCPFCGMADTKRSMHRPLSFEYECGTHFIPAKHHVAKQDWSARSKACEEVAALRAECDNYVAGRVLPGAWREYVESVEAERDTLRAELEKANDG